MFQSEAVLQLPEAGEIQIAISDGGTAVVAVAVAVAAGSLPAAAHR